MRVIFKTVLAVFGCALLGMAFGGGVGYLLGFLAPGFFRAILPLTSEDADFVQIGVGLGIVNGSLLGTAVGTIVIGILTGIRFTTREYNDREKNKK